MASLQPLAGKLGDRVGRRPLLLGGLAWFAAASAAAAAPSLELLVAFRVQQALAGALIVPNGVALLRGRPDWQARVAAWPRRRRAPLAAALGPLLGGLASARAGRLAGGLPRQPAATGRAAGGGLALDSGGAGASDSAGFDLGGAALLCASLVALAWLLNGPGASPPASAALAAVVAASAGAFTWRELRHPDPTLDLRLFRRGPLSTASGAVGRRARLGGAGPSDCRGRGGRGKLGGGGRRGLLDEPLPRQHHRDEPARRAACPCDSRSRRVQPAVRGAGRSGVGGSAARAGAPGRIVARVGCARQPISP